MMAFMSSDTSSSGIMIVESKCFWALLTSRYEPIAETNRNIGSNLGRTPSKFESYPSAGGHSQNP